MLKIRVSSLSRHLLCPGSRKASDGLESENSAQSIAGTGGHRILGNTEKTGYYDRWIEFDGVLCPSVPIESLVDGLDNITAGRCCWYVKTIDELISSHGGAKEIYTEVEMSALLLGGIELEGHADLIIVFADGITAVFDYKFNFLEVSPAPQNIQLRGYVTLIVKSRSLPFKIRDKVHAVLIAGGNETPFTATEYTKETMPLVLSQILSIVQNTITRCDERTPSEEACKYCPAKCSTRCPETLAEIGAAATLLPAVTESLLPASKEAVVRIWNMAKEAERLAAAYIDRVKAEVIANPEAWADSFKVCKTGSTRTIKDAQEAYSAVVEREGLLSGPEFLSLVNVPITALTEALKVPLKAKDIPVKEHKRIVEELLAGNIEHKEKHPTVKAV